MGTDRVEETKRNATSTKRRTRKPASRIPAIERDVLIAEAQSVVKLWASADKAMGSADARAIHCLVVAQEKGFFGRGARAAANLRNWHKLTTKESKTAVADSVLHDLFCIEKPVAADRQRLQRVQYIVPSILKAGGEAIFQLSNSGQVMLDVTTDYFKQCEPKTEATGRLALSIAKLDKGARLYLKKELPVAKRGKKGSKNKQALDAVPMLDVFKRAGDLVRKTPASKLTAQQNGALQTLLIDLLGIFCADKDGDLDTGAINGIYHRDEPASTQQAA